MHGFGQSLSTGITFAIMTVITLVLSMLMLSENSQQQSANSIVQTALLDASNNNAKAVDGTMVVNTQRFEQNLQQSSIDNWRKHSQSGKGSKAEMAISVYYLDDNSKNANDFHKLESPKNPANKAIKGVKVVVVRLIKTTPKAALKKLSADQKTVNKQLGVANSDKQAISTSELEQLSNNETVYLVQPTDIITYLVSGHGSLRNDDIANGIPKTTPDKNNRNHNSDGYLASYAK